MSWPGRVNWYDTVMRPSIPPLPSRSWPRRPTELNTKSVGRLALKSIIYFEIVTTIALFIGLGSGASGTVKLGGGSMSAGSIFNYGQVNQTGGSLSAASSVQVRLCSR